MSEESQVLVASSSGIQTVIQQSATEVPQVVYLDFDGAETSYNGELVTIDNVTVEDSGFDSESIAFIVDVLNEQFGDDVVFTADIPQTYEYSTIYIGVTSAFESYGDFLGLAETIDSGNKIHNDNAFVLLNFTTSLDLVTSVIAHETEHIVHGTEHEGTGLEKYAWNLTWDISKISNTPHTTPFVNNIAGVPAGTTFSIRIASKQTSGIYYLATNALFFNENITVETASGSYLGIVYLGMNSPVNCNGNKLMLKLHKNSGILYLTVNYTYSNGTDRENQETEIELPSDAFDTFIRPTYIITKGPDWLEINKYTGDFEGKTGKINGTATGYGDTEVIVQAT